MVFVAICIGLIISAIFATRYASSFRLEARADSGPDLELEFGPAPGGELEWAYGLLECAKQEEERAKREEVKRKLRKKCEQRGHIPGPEMTAYDRSPGFLCIRCGSMVSYLELNERTRLAASLPPAVLLDPRLLPDLDTRKVCKWCLNVCDPWNTCCENRLH